MDLVTLILVALLIATLVAFVTGLAPYPFGLLVLLAFLVARLAHLARDRGSKPGADR